MYITEDGLIAFLEGNLAMHTEHKIYQFFDQAISLSFIHLVKQIYWEPVMCQELLSIDFRSIQRYMR